MEADLGLDLWPGPDHWDGLHFVGFNVGISFIITECYANVASNHPSIKIAALRSPDQNSRAFRVSPLLWLHSVSKVNVSSSRPPPPSSPLGLDFSPTQLPRLPIASSAALSWLALYLWLHSRWGPAFSCFQLDLDQNCEAVSPVAKSFISGANYGHHLEQLPSELAGLTNMSVKGIPQC